MLFCTCLHFVVMGCKQTEVSVHINRPQQLGQMCQVGVCVHWNSSQMYVHIHTYCSICVYVCTCVHTYIHTYGSDLPGVCMCSVTQLTDVCIHTWCSICVCVCVCVYMCTYIHMYIHTMVQFIKNCAFYVHTLY